ncbi:hypothetical protein L218DRAFT_922088 [Marasmius fiardii PR-910]|nr:hypothetical protein L218DRAFT_922088 [Marasmius fiardii PR-910]
MATSFKSTGDPNSPSDNSKASATGGSKHVSSKLILNDIAAEDASEIVKVMKKTQDILLAKKSPVDPLLDSILSRTVEGDRTRPVKPVTQSTVDTPRRRIFRFWPRDPDGPVLRYSSEGKHAPNATHLWGSTLYDFYHTNRMPFNEHSVTITTGSRMAGWCKEIDELDYAAQEIDWAENREEDPKKREAVNPADVHEATVDFKLSFTRWGKSEIEKAKTQNRKDDDVENYRTPFHPSSYPTPYPTPPFVTGTIPRLESTIPLHLLPETLVVHDPYRVVCVPPRHQGSDDESDRKSSDHPWPFDSSDPSNPKGYISQKYKLELGPSARQKIAEMRETVESAITTDPIPVFYVYPAAEDCRTRDPIFEITIPAPPPPPTHTPEAHLFLTRTPAKKKGTGNHSVVFEGEWEVPREWFVKPKICVRCVMERAQAVRDDWVAAKEDRVSSDAHQNEKDVDNSHFESSCDDSSSGDTNIDGSSTLPDLLPEDVVLPGLKQALISFPQPKVTLWGRAPEHDEILPVDHNSPESKERVDCDAGPHSIHDTVETDADRPYIGNVRIQRETYESSAFTMSLKTVQQMRDEHDKLAKSKRGDNYDPWEKYREDSAKEGTPITETPSKQQAASEDINNEYPKMITVPIVVYTGTMRTIHISSVPWLLPGDPPCGKHGIQDLHSLANFKYESESGEFSPLVPCSALPTDIRSTTRLPPTMRVTICVKASIPGDEHLCREAMNYQKFDPSFSEHWTGYTVAKPLLEPTPCGALVPGFYGYYVREGEGSGEVEDTKEKPKPKYFSPLLLLEDCGEPIDVRSLNLDDRYECSALLLRFHELGWTQGSFAPRNLLMRRGDHGDYATLGRSRKDKRFRLIDFGRAAYLEDIPREAAERRDQWDGMRFYEKNEICKIMELPTPM